MDFLDEQILQLKKKHSDPNYVAPNLQNVVPQDDNEQGLGTWLGAAGIGAGRMLNNTITGGLAQILGSIGSGVEYISPFSGSQAKDRVRLMSLGIPYETAKEIYPDQDSWLTSGAKGLLEAQNYIDDNLSELRNEIVGDNPSYGTQVAEGTGSSLGFMGAGYGAGALSSLAGLGPFGVILAAALAAGATEALSESGGTLGDAYRQGKYDDGGLAAANKSFAANALLNAGLNYVGGHFSPLTAGIRNPLTKFAVNSLGQIGNELLQEPSQQTIEKATQDSLNNGGNFLTALSQNIPDWWDTAKQLAPSVAGSSLVTSLLTGGAAMASPKIRQNVYDQWRNRMYDPEQTAENLKSEMNARQKLLNQLQRTKDLTPDDTAKIDSLNDRIEKANRRIATYQDRLKPGNFDYTPNPYDEFSGKVSRVSTIPGQNQYNTVFKLMNADDIITSHNDDFSLNEQFPQDRQIRQRDSSENRREVERIASQLDPLALGDNYHAQNGAPIIGQDNTDLSGNGRVLAIRQAYKNNSEQAQKYRQFIIDNAANFGVDPDLAATMKNPVLVRVLQGDVDLAKFATEANSNTIQQLSTGEQAKKDIEILTKGNIMSQYDPSKPLIQQKELLKAFAAELQPNERNQFFTDAGEGEISQAGLTRIQNSIFAAAYGNNQIIGKLTEATNDISTNISNTLKSLAPSFLQLKASNRGRYDLSQDLAQAIDNLDGKRRNSRVDKKTVSEQIEQPNLEGNGQVLDENLDLSPEADLLLRFFNQNGRNPNAILQGLANYAKKAMEQAEDGQQTLFNDQNMEKIDILRQMLGDKSAPQNISQQKTNAPVQQTAQQVNPAQNIQPTATQTTQNTPNITALSNSSQSQSQEHTQNQQDNINNPQAANLVHNRQINSYDEEIQRSKSAPDYSESSNPSDLRLYPNPQNEQAYNSWDTIGLNGNQQEDFDVPNIADISALQQEYSNEQQTQKPQANSPNLSDNQGRGNLGSDTGNRSKITNQREQEQVTSKQGNQDNFSTANQLNNQRPQAQINSAQDNSQGNSFAVPQYADISGLIQSEQNNDEYADTAETLNRRQNETQQKLSPIDEAKAHTVRLINNELQRNPHGQHDAKPILDYLNSLPKNIAQKIIADFDADGILFIHDEKKELAGELYSTGNLVFQVRNMHALSNLSEQFATNQQDNNQQLTPKTQDNSGQNFANIDNQQERSKSDDYLPPENIKTKDGDITARGARLQRSFIPSEQAQIQKAARTGKPATRYIFAKHGEHDTSAPTANNPEKYSYDAKLTGYNGYLGDIQIAAGDNSVPLHAFFGTQDGRHYVGITDQNGDFFATYDLQNNQFFINEGSEDNPLVKNYSAQRIEKDFRLAFTYNNDSNMDIDFSKNPTEEILRRLVMMKAINAGVVDTAADADSQIYMAMNKYFSSQSGVPLLDMVMADNLIINKVNRQGENGDRGSTKITPEMGIDGNPIFEAQTILSLFKNSDVSTVPHEFWHIYEEKIKRLANAGLIKKGSKLWQDWQTIRSEAGMLGVDFSQKLSPQDNAKWINSQEKNAAMFEQYLRQGKAPQGISDKLKAVFNNFKNWLGNLYRKAKDIFYTNANGRRISQPQVSKPMRQVFDHIFASDKKFNVNQSTEQGQKLSSYSDTQGFQEFRQSGLDPQGWFSRGWHNLKNWAGNLFHSVARAGLPKHATDWRSLPFPTQEIQGRFMEAMKPAPRLGMIGRMRQTVRDIAQSIKGGDYSDITLSPRKNDTNLHLNEALQAFRNLGRAKVAAADNAVTTMTDIIRPLNQKQRELLNTYTVIRDVIDQIEEMPNSPLSFGLSQQDARKMNAELARMVDQDEQVRDAIKQLDDTRNAQVEEFKKHAKALGLNMDNLFHYHNYFRRRVIQYLNAARSGKRTPSAQGNLDIQDRYTGELRDIMGRDFFKKRKGTLLDYITDYVQANAEVRAQLAQDIETMKTLEYIRKNHDIAPRLRKQHNIKSQQLEIDYDGSQTFSQSGEEEQKTIHDVIPEGYEAFDPSATRLIETAQSVPENLMHMVANDIAEQHGIPVDDILERLGIQNDNNLMVIPSEIANTLRKMAKSRHRGMLGQAAKDFTTWWKRSVLFTPTRNLLYNIRNFTGDLDALIAGNPKALRHLPHAVRELTGWYTQHGKEGYEASQDLQDYIRLSGNLGIQSLNLSAKDAQAIVSLLDTGQTEKDASKIKSLWNKSLKPIRKFFNVEHSFTEWREHLLRYAAYLEYKNQMESNKDGRPSNWGASIEDEVMSIEDIKERAFKMSNELLGAYDQVSEVGKQLRDMLIPFYSWMEVNMRRTYRLLKNGFKYGYGTQQVKNLGVGKLAAMPLYAFSAGQSVVKLMAFTMALQMFNRMVFPQADDDLPNDVKYRPHITLGTHNGRTYYFDRIGAVADVLDWASLDSAWLDAKDFANGQKSLGSWLKQIVQAPFSKAINGLNPAIKMPIELAMGRSMFPNAFNPSTIRDPAEYVARSFGLAWPYKAARGIPHSNAQEASKLFIYSQDTDEAAYWQTLDRVRQFQNEVLDKHFDGFASTRRGRILANIKKALRYKDREALRRFLREYSQADGSKQGLKSSMNAMNPLHGLNEKEKKQFMKWISADDRKYLRKAQRYFHQLADRFIR